MPGRDKKGSVGLEINFPPMILNKYLNLTPNNYRQFKIPMTDIIPGS
jgi:hypothetical protein